MTALVELASTAATLLAIAGVVLNNHRRRGCFYLWLLSNSITLAVHLHAYLWAMSARDAIFLALAFHGLHKWKTKP